MIDWLVGWVADRLDLNSVRRTTKKKTCVTFSFLYATRCVASRHVLHCILVQFSSILCNTLSIVSHYKYYWPVSIDYYDSWFVFQPFFEIHFFSWANKKVYNNTYVLIDFNWFDCDFSTKTNKNVNFFLRYSTKCQYFNLFYINKYQQVLKDKLEKKLQENWPCQSTYSIWTEIFIP